MIGSVILALIVSINFYASYLLFDKSNLVGFIPLAAGCVALNALYKRAYNVHCKRI